MQSIKRFFWSLLFLFISIAQLFADDSVTNQTPIQFKLLYSPPNKLNCQSVSTQYLYGQEGATYHFKIVAPQNIFDHPSFQKRWFSKESAEFQVHMTTKSGIQKLQTFSGHKFKKSSYCIGKSCSLVAFDFNLKLPKAQSVIYSTYQNIDANAIDIYVALYDTSSNTELAHSSYPLRLLSKDTIIFNKANDESRYYTLEALPDSPIYDNYERMDPLKIEYTLNQSKQYKNLLSGNYGYGIAAMFTSEKKFRFFDSPYFMPNAEYNTFLSDNGFNIPIFHPFQWDVSFAVNATTFKENLVSLDIDSDIIHSFYLAPGETGIIFNHPEIEEATFEKLAPDACGFLSRQGTEKLKIIHSNFSLINVEREMANNSSYLKDLANKYLPIYDYIAKERQ